MRPRISASFFALVAILLLTACQAPRHQGPSYYEPWYLSFELSNEPQLPEVSPELQKYQIKLPVSYKQEQNGIEMELNFFQEYYRIGELIQLRITVTNHSDQPIQYEQGHYGETISGTGSFICSNGQMLHFYEDCSAAPLNGGSWVTDDVKMISCASGKSNVLEYSYFADADFFCSDDAKDQQFHFSGSVNNVEFHIPVEIVYLP